MELETNRLFIRPFQESDWSRLYGYARQTAVMHYIPGGALDKQGAKAFVRTNSGNKAKAFAVIEKHSDSLIGHIDFFDYFGGHTYEIGWVFDPKWQRRGFATEAAQACIDEGFSNIGLHRIVATCQPENTASWKLMETIGMRKEGFCRQCIPTRSGGWWDEYLYAILREEWAEKRLK
ncbi:GNAT family protein [Shouchella clausii]